MQKFRNCALATATAALLADSRSNNPLFWFGFGRKKKSSPESSHTYIWGNGYYSPNPSSAMKFGNFEPKKIRTFDGRVQACLKKLYFGECFEAAIDVNGDVLLWPLNVLHASPEPSVDYNKRDDVVPLDSDGKNVQLAFTKRFLWVLKEDGSVYQYGVEGSLNERTRFASLNKVSTKKRKIASLKNIKMISCGMDHFVALDKDGKVFTMGDDTLGQCGLGDFGRTTGGPFYERRVRNPEIVPNLPKVSKIVAGHNHTIAITEDGDCVGWGSNSHLQLSHEAEYSRVTNPLLASFLPIRIDKKMGNNKFVDAACGDNFTIFVTENKKNSETEVFGSGHCLLGELGINRTKHISDVTKIEGLSNFTLSNEETGEEMNMRVSEIECGSNHCMALLSLGAVLTWGANEFGQLGNKRRIFRSKPVLVKQFSNKNVRSISCGYTNSGVVTDGSKSSEKKAK